MTRQDTVSKTVNIVCRAASEGQHRDLTVLRTYFTSRGWTTRYVKAAFDQEHPDGPFRHFLPVDVPRADVSVTVEGVIESAATAARNYFIPNLEFMFTATWADVAQTYSAVLARTTDVLERCAQESIPAVHTGFTTPQARTRNRTPRDPGSPHYYVHVAGNSRMKNTEWLLRQWQVRPHWPNLIVVGTKYPRLTGSNITRVGHLSRSDLVRVMRGAAAHIIPSATEGWGHVLCETLTSGTLLVTSDAPPMNSIAAYGPHCLAVEPDGSKGYATLWRPKKGELARVVDDVEGLSLTERRALLQRQREHSAEQRALFYAAMDSVFQG